eukprot:1504672-Prymnesium_polylepis.1
MEPTYVLRPIERPSPRAHMHVPHPQLSFGSGSALWPQSSLGIRYRKGEALAARPGLACGTGVFSDIA